MLDMYGNTIGVVENRPLTVCEEEPEKKNDRTRLFEAVKTDTLFELMATYGHEFTKGDLCDVIKELDYAISRNVDEFDKSKVKECVLSELEERWESCLGLGE
jgi:hypothetical protein